MEKIDREVEFLINKKVKEFSFHVSGNMQNFVEIEQLNQIVEKSIEDYKISKKLGRLEDAKKYQAVIKEMKFAKEHLIKVMNMDFN